MIGNRGVILIDVAAFRCGKVRRGCIAIMQIVRSQKNVFADGRRCAASGPRAVRRALMGTFRRQAPKPERSCSPDLELYLGRSL